MFTGAPEGPHRSWTQNHTNKAVSRVSRKALVEHETQDTGSDAIKGIKTSEARATELKPHYCEEHEKKNRNDAPVRLREQSEK